MNGYFNCFHSFQPERTGNIEKAFGIEGYYSIILDDIGWRSTKFHMNSPFNGCSAIVGDVSFVYSLEISHDMHYLCEK